MRLILTASILRLREPDSSSDRRRTCDPMTGRLHRNEIPHENGDASIFSGVKRPVQLLTDIGLRRVFRPVRAWAILCSERTWRSLWGGGHTSRLSAVTPPVWGTHD
jgi:hypothetical protein